MTETTKRCRRCEIEKSAGAFARNTSKRDGLSSWCRDCIAGYNRAYYRENRAGTLARVKRWRKSNPEYQAQYRRANRVRLAVQRADHRRRKPELHRASEARRRAAINAVPAEMFTYAEIWERDGGVCGVCYGQADPMDWHLDHIKPLSKGGSHTRENVQVAHPECNVRKGTKDGDSCLPMLAA